MDVDALFQALRDGAVAVAERRGVVRLRGADARSFLHRMTTQHTEALAPGEAALNVLPNKQGRCVDLVHQLTLAEDDVALLSALPEGETTRDWLDEFLFVEDVEVEDETAASATALVAGADAAALLGAEGLAPWAMARSGARVVVRTFDLGGPDEAWPAFWVWETDTTSEALLSDLGATAVPDVEAARVASGVPAAPGEVCDRYNPLELALHDAIHWAKGCYIGQEVIARIDNYGKQSRQLVGLALDELAGVIPGVDVTRDGKVVGAVTSVAPGRVDGGISALAVVKHKGDASGATFDVAGQAATVLSRRAEQVPHD